MTKNLNTTSKCKKYNKCDQFVSKNDAKNETSLLNATTVKMLQKIPLVNATTKQNMNSSQHVKSKYLQKT